MPATYKKKPIRVYLDAEEYDMLKRLTTAVGVLTQSMVISTLCSAALRACAEAGYRMPLPLKFDICEAGEPLHERAKVPSRR